MSRILKALATIESKGGTLTLSLPRDDAPQRPRRKEGARRAELSLATLEAYLQAALAAEPFASIDAHVSDAVALYCSSRSPCPLLELDAAIAAGGEFEEGISNWAVRESGPAPRSAMVDFDTPCEPLPEPIAVETDAAEEFSSLGLDLIPADDIVEAAVIEPLSWSESLWHRVAELSAAIEVEAAAIEPGIVDLASFKFDAVEDLRPWSASEVSLPAAAETVETATPGQFPGWPDALLFESPNIECFEFELDAVTIDAAAPEPVWLERYHLLPAEPHGQLDVSCPDWFAVEAAIQSRLEQGAEIEEVFVVEVEESADPRTIEPPPVVRRRLSSREMLPAQGAWDECRAIVDGLLAQWDGAACAWLFVELAPQARRAPVVAPLAAMLTESIQGRVLLVDTDCRESHDLQALRENVPCGFADVLRRPDAWSEFVQCSSVERLDVIPAGQYSFAESTARAFIAADDWLKKLGRTYDLVLLHAIWPGAASLAQLSGSAAATCLVAPLGAIEQAAAEEAIQQLRRWGANVQGCILTEL